MDFEVRRLCLSINEKGHLFVIFFLSNKQTNKQILKSVLRAHSYKQRYLLLVSIEDLKNQSRISLTPPCSRELWSYKKILVCFFLINRTAQRLKSENQKYDVSRLPLP